MIPFNLLTATRHGAMVYHRFDAYVGSSLDRYGEYSPDETDFLCALVGPGSIVIDGGANIGALTIPLARTVGPTGHVIAIEPQRLTFQALCANVALNSLPNVDTLRAALGQAPGHTLVPVPNLLQPGNFGRVELGAHQEGERVPVVRLDDLTLPGMTLLKLDVEGMERAVLRGARRTLRDHQPILYVEADREEERPALLDDLRRLGYRLFWHMPPLYRAQNYRSTHENVFGDLLSINVLALPAHDTRDFGLEAI